MLIKICVKWKLIANVYYELGHGVQYKSVYKTLAKKWKIKCNY